MLRRTLPRLGGCQAGFPNSSLHRCGNYSNQRAMCRKVVELSQLKPRTEVFPCVCLAWGRDFRRPPCGGRFGWSEVRFGEGNDNPLHYSFLGNPMDRGAWQAMAHRVAESRTRLKRLSTHSRRSDCQLRVSEPGILKKEPEASTEAGPRLGGGTPRESESRSVVSDSLRPHGLYSPWNSPGQNTGVDSRSLLQGIFPTQGWNPGLPHCRLDSLPAGPPGGVRQGDPEQAEIQISPPYRLRSAPAGGDAEGPTTG